VSAAYDPLDYGPLWRAIEGTDMKRVNQMRLYRLGSVSRLRNIRVGDTFDEYINWTWYPMVQLQAFAENEEYQRILPFSVQKAAALRSAAHGVFHEKQAADQSDIDYVETLLSSFEASLDDELQRLHTYQVDQVAAYSFDRLIGAADTVFPEDQRKDGTIPERALADFRSAGRCLAFDLPTACGFHAFRAADTMIRAYYAHFVVAPKPTKEPRDWGGYIRAFRDVLTAQFAHRKPNVRTVELLDSIRATDRNPVIHPEQELDSGTALAMFDLCKNAILLMALDIKAAP